MDTVTAVNAFSEVSKVAPYVIGAYVLIWVTLSVYIGLVMTRLSKLEREVRVVEEALERRTS